MQQSVNGKQMKAIRDKIDTIATLTEAMSNGDYSEKIKRHNKEKDYRKKLREKQNNSQSKVEEESMIVPRYFPEKKKPETIWFNKPKENNITEKKITREVQPLYKRAELLKEKVHMLNYKDNLYCYNGKCYDMVDSMDIVKLYRQKVDNTLNGEKSMNNISQLYQFLRTDADICVREHMGSQWFAVLNNGIYDVMKEELIPHSHKITSFSYIDANYDEFSSCKHFDKFIHKVAQGDFTIEERLWLFLGYTFMQTTEAKVFFVMGVAPDSGKSLLGNFIESLYPTKYVSNIALTDFNKEFSLAPLVGSAVNISLDLPSSRLNSVAVSRLKMLTGGDAVNINQKYVPVFRYESRAKFIFASNSPITIMDDDEAFWRRVVYLPFDKTVPKEKQNRELATIFQQEKDAIVSKALRYAKKLILNGFKFPSTPSIDRRMQEWQGRDCATIENFIQECCQCNPEYRGELMDNLYSNYEKYCDNIGYVPRNRSAFKQFLEKNIGLKHFKMRGDGVNPQSAFRGIKLSGIEAVSRCDF